MFRFYSNVTEATVSQEVDPMSALKNPLMKPDETIQIKAIEQYFHVVLFIMPYKVVLTLKSADETLVCDHLNESY